MSTTNDAEPLTLKEAGGAYLGAMLLAWLLIAADRIGVYGAGRIPYGNGNGCDVWYYYSLIISPQSGSVFGPGTRFVSRPLYFVPAHIVKELFPSFDPNTASYVFFLPLAVWALYLGLRAVFARTPSIAGALLIGSAPLFINMASATYVPMGAAAYMCCMLACLMWTGRLAGTRPAAHLLTSAAAGLFFVFAANANMMAIKFDFIYVLFALPVQFLAGGARSYRTAVILTARAAGAFIVGAVAGGLVTLGLSYLFGLGFYAPLVQIAEAISGIDQSRFGNWQRETVAFTLVALISILSVFACYRQYRKNDVSALRIYLVAAVTIGTCLFHLLAFAELADMSMVFDWWYFLLLPCVPLAFCAAVADLIERRSKAALMALAGTVIAANLLLSQIHFLKQELFDSTQRISYVVVVALAVFMVWQRRRPDVVGVTALVALSLQAANSSIMHQHYFLSLEEVQNQARATERALTFILAHTKEKPVIWVANTDNHRLDLPIVRGMIRCTYELAFPSKLPEPDLHWQTPLAPGRTLVLIDGNASPESDIQAALAAHGMALDVLANRYFWRMEKVEPGVQITIGKVR